MRSNRGLLADLVDFLAFLVVMAVKSGLLDVVILRRLNRLCCLLDLVPEASLGLRG